MLQMCFILKHSGPEKDEIFLEDGDKVEVCRKLGLRGIMILKKGRKIFIPYSNLAMIVSREIKEG